MALLITIVVIICVAGLCAWLVQALPIPEPVKTVGVVLIALAALIVVAQRAGMV